jgi:hypothetical protein
MTSLFSRVQKGLQAFLTLSVLALAPAASQTATASGSAKILACDYGTNGGLRPVPLPSGYDWWLADAVVEIHSQKEIKNVAATDFTLFDKTRKVLRLKRVIAVAVFDEPPYPSAGIAGKGSMAYYDEPDHTRPWDGTLPAGMIRLWVSVALIEDSYTLSADENVKCRITVGPYMIEDAATGMWGT